MQCDFNGDGRGDLAVGVPGETVRGEGGAGAVIVSYSIAGALLHSVLTTSAVTPPSAQARFGSALACGDFDADGRDDLAVAAAGWNGDAGEVFVFYGDPGGLGTNPTVANLLIRQENVGETSEKGDAFGIASATGDLDGDGNDDLAVGSPGEDWELESLWGEVGLVYVVPGSPVGLLTPGKIVKECCDPDHRAPARYGHALAMGDVDGDGRDDLAIGAPSANVLERNGFVIPGAGLVQVLRGSALSMITTNGMQLFWEGAFLGWSSKAGNTFGTALAFGDFDGNGFADLAIGGTTEVDDVARAGAVFVAPSDGVGPHSAGPVVAAGWGALPGGPASGDAFGHSLATGDLDGDGRDDLAIGVPSAVGSRVSSAGTTVVVYGGAAGLDDGRAHQIGGSEVEVGLAGFAVAMVDLDGDGVEDLAVGIPGQTVDFVAHAGEVRIHRGVPGDGITTDAPIVVTEGLHAGWSETGDPGSGSSWYEWGWLTDPVSGERLGTAIGR